MSAKRRPNIRKKYIILAVLLAIVCGGAAYAVRFLAERELQKGRTMLKKQDYDAAAGEFRRVAGSKKYHVKARGLLLYSLVMEGKNRRPMQAHTGVDSAGLLRLMALYALVHDERIDRDDPEIQDIAERVDRSTAGVIKRLKEQGVDIRNWQDARNVFLWFARAAWQNPDTDRAAAGQTEARVLDFTAALIGMQGGDRQLESRALRHLAGRLAAPDAPLEMAALAHSPAFQQLLEAAALSGKQPQGGRAREILRRQRFYARLQWIAEKKQPLARAQDMTLAPELPLALREKLLARYPVFAHDNKVWEELSGWGFDPTAFFWVLPFGAPEQGPDIAWAYGAASGRSEFINYFLVFSDALQWEVLRFAGSGDPLEKFVTRDMPVAGFVYCPRTAELAINIPVYDQAAGAFMDQWTPFPVDLENRLLQPAGAPRPAACPAPPGNRTPVF